MSTIAPVEMVSAYGNATSSPSVVSSTLGVPTYEFGIDFMRNLSRARGNQNVLFSPLSIILCYSMVLEGAHGETEQQMREVLRLMSIGNRTEVNMASKKLLEGYKQIEDGSSDRNLTLAIANRAMVSKNAKLKEAFTQNLMANYFAEATNEDFTDGTNVMNKVNAWVAQKTRNKISRLLSRPPASDAVLLLVNTLYFKGTWATQFPKEDTYNGTFMNGDGSTSKVAMMTLRDEEFDYFHDQANQLKGIQIPYHGDVSMLLFMPTGNNTLDHLVSNDLSLTHLESLIDSMHSTKLKTVSIPKFKLEDEHTLHQILPDMGMNLLFSDLAQLSNIVESSVPLRVSESIQKVLLEVDEEGSTAAAVTYLNFAYASAFIPPAENFVADRPFLFLIRDRRAKVNLFMGQMSKMAQTIE